MNTNLIKRFFIFSIAISAIAFASACQQNTNPNSNAGKTNTNQSNPGTANTNDTTTSNTIETKEPEQYRATVTLKFETTGEKSMTIPPLTAQVAHNGSANRLEFTLPNGEKLIYLDMPGKHLLIAPSRKQYAELTREAVGFEIRNLMTPAQMVEKLKNLKGYERVGEEQVNGRTAIKYRYSKTTDTNTKAGTIETEAEVLVDKETGLPLRSETISESKTGNVKGVTGLKLVTEMSNIQTTAEQSLFTEPTDMKKVEAEQVRQQINTLFSAAAALLTQIMQNTQADKPPATPTVTPTATPAQK